MTKTNNNISELSEQGVLIIGQILLLMLKEKIENSTNSQFTYEELKEFTKDQRYQQLQNAQCIVDGSPYFLTMLDSLFELENDFKFPISKKEILNRIEDIEKTIWLNTK